MASFDVVGIGACAVDYLGIVSELPSPDTKKRMKQFIRQGGGPASTALVALSRLGASVSYIGKFGDDELSRFTLDEFDKEGVDTSHIIREEGAGPTFAFVIVDEKSAERTVLWTDEQVSQVKQDEFKKEVIASSGFVLLDEYRFESALAAGRIAKEAGVQVVLDAERPELPDMDKLVQITDILIVPEEFALGFGEGKDIESSAEILLGLGPRVVAVTLGAKGSFCKTADESFYQPAFQVEAVDTTGCGDVFHGGFTYGLLQNWPLKVTAEFASAVSALKCRALGGRAATPTLDEMKAFLLERGSEEINKRMASL